MADWSLMDSEWPNLYDPYQYGQYPYYQEKQPPVPQFLQPQAQPYVTPTSPTLTLLLSSPQHLSPPTLQYNHVAPPRENPREIRNKAEKQRRDKLNQSISELAAMVPPVVAASRKIDKTGVLRLTAHYLRAHQHVFGNSIAISSQEINFSCVQAVLGLLNGFLLTVTYKGIVVVVSQNVHQFLGYTELELLGQSIMNITHEDDRGMLKEQLMPNSQMLGPNGELIVPDEPDGKQRITKALANDKRNFFVRFKKLGQRSEPSQYVMCHVDGSFRKADRACRGFTRCCQIVRRVRARGDSTCSSGNDVVFIGIVRPSAETFINESLLEAYRMEYRTRHSIDGEIIQCDQRIALATGYMSHEVNGVNAMNFMHRDDVRWVIIALREMYDQQRLFGESCYRLMTKNGQFIYMKTRGRLDVDKNTRAVTSFICTNTVVDEVEGKYLIKLMKEKFSLLIRVNADSKEDEEILDVNDSETKAVEDPRQLEKVILHLVTNLPSPKPDDSTSSSDALDCQHSSSLHLSIIPPRKEKIVSAIEKMYTVFKDFQTQPKMAPENIDINIGEGSGVKITEIDTANSPPIIESAPVIGTYPNSSHYSQIPAIPIPLAPWNGSPQEFEFPKTLINPDPVAHSSCTSDVEYISGPGIPVESYDDKSSVACSNFLDDTGLTQAETEMISNVIISPEMNANETTNFKFESNTLPMQLPNAIKTGTKRPNEYDDDTICKKKIVDFTNQEHQSEQTPTQDFISLEKIFDEAIENTQIESAIRSLELGTGPSFPDFLMSQEVHDILKEIEESDENGSQFNA